MLDSTQQGDGGDEAPDRIREILSYHRSSKHDVHRYAEGPDGLDWANQPDPFRTYAGAPAIELPFLADAIVASYGDLYVPGAIAPRRPALDTLAILFELSLGLSAWKEYRGSRWALRCNPSSGNLHPTESYAVVPALPGVVPGVYHYASREHRLETRFEFEAAAAAAVTNLLPAGCFLIGLSSVHWREAWKYGIRAYRYCQHDAGHAMAAVRYAAAALGWSAQLIDAPGDAEVAALLGLDRNADFAAIDALDHEHPDTLVVVGPPPISAPNLSINAVRGGIWTGAPNRLSRDHTNWESISQAMKAAWKPRTKPGHVFVPPPLPPLADLFSDRTGQVPAATLMRQRRSAVDFDGQTAIDASTLYRMLDHLLPRPKVPPWDLLPWRPHLHPGLFLHRVNGLPPGLYLFERDPDVHDRLKAATRPSFLWRRPAGCPDHLHLYFLAEGDLRQTARNINCHQDIAANGAFNLGMVAEFGEVISARGPWWYRRLFWEAGVLGQVLYLEAEAADVRGTGIGCYFDDAMHNVLGLAGDCFQSLYHFAVGGPVEDSRLRTIPPYLHLAQDFGR